MLHTEVSRTIEFSTLEEPLAQWIVQIETARQPIVITRDGDAVVVLVQAEEYLQMQHRFALLQDILRARQETADRSVLTGEEVEALLAGWVE